ncbi:helix-turn-helix transcriptional regulator [Saccharopolyspora shandongensis]|uniref:Transcriptional regulator, contains XRE-family HTH domain n=1 Tax=Saccharopolyspora shandongensis TaxID=418495 RepID=A0A1H2TZZ2_9PSEU|nr:helix-turn-helix transcriptional regulator [Saccharopolyspora shandongensis]SDW49583.1 Transcriptional regulator, contains XRE-family HTH domain [Saccharopolyspora shandongensis]
MTVLLREAVGERLRRARTAQSRTLRDVSRAARVSLGYLSEVERGRKEASSELLASICDALDLPLPELLVTVAGDLDETLVVPSVVEQATPAEIDGGRLVPSLIGTELSDAELAKQQLTGAEAGTDAEPRACADRLQPMLSQRISAPVRKPGGVVVAA